MTATPADLISVVIPTRNRVALLRRTLEALTAAAGPDVGPFEVVVSDDGDAVATARAIGDSYPGIRVVQGPGRGPAANRNAGARAAHGIWLAFTDDDTEPSVGWLAAFRTAMVSGTEVYEGRTTCDGGFQSPLNHAPINETGGRLWSCNFMVAKAAFDSVGGFDEGFPFPHMEDQDLRIRFESAGYRRAWVPHAVVNHPPRRQPSGRRLGEYRESEVRFHVKHHGTPEARRALLARVIRYRLGVIRDTPKSLDTVVALGSLARETWHVVTHVSEWERMAMREFAQAHGSTIDLMSRQR
jgi:GT2 family glycosyltransferase